MSAKKKTPAKKTPAAKRPAPVPAADAPAAGNRSVSAPVTCQAAEIGHRACRCGGRYCLPAE